MNYRRLIISLVVPQLAGLFGSIFTVAAIPAWYASLVKPSFSPPSWLFGPVWFILYLLMGISIYLIWQKIGENKKVRTALWFFWIHLVFNAVWSPVFFGLKNPGFALVNIILIWLFIIVLIVKFWNINKWSTYLLIPYLFWVSFATVLNYFLWYLN